MKELIQEKLNKVEDLNQRRLLKNILSQLFLNLVEYQEETIKNLEERIFNEVEDFEEKYDVYVTICPKDEIDPLHEFLYPMMLEDLEEHTHDMENIVSKINNNEELSLMTIFLQCDYLQIKDLVDKERIFNGELITSTGKQAIKVKLKQKHTYIQQIERLYQIFQMNRVPWKTVSHPYAYKFFDVVMVSCTKEFTIEEEIREININLEEFEPYKQLGIVPLWNIERLTLSTKGFPVPASDRINFEHILSLQEVGVENGYLVDGIEEHIRYLKRTEDELIVVSPKEKSGDWNVLKFTQPVRSRIGRLKRYPIVSNKRRNSFISGFARKHPITVRAKGEIARIINSFELTNYLEFIDIELKDISNDVEQTYNLNTFVTDYIRNENDKKIMYLKFKNLEQNNIISYDIMSFLVSEIQMYFPEYKCEGVLT